MTPAQVALLMTDISEHMLDSATPRPEKRGTWSSSDYTLVVRILDRFVRAKAIDKTVRFCAEKLYSQDVRNRDGVRVALCTLGAPSDVSVEVTEARLVLRRFIITNDGSLIEDK